MDKTEALKLANDYVAEVIKIFNPAIIVLYGSFAKGNYREESDIDIGIIFNGFSDDFLTVSSKLYRLTRNISSYLEPRLMDLANDKSGFIEEILKSAEILYSNNSLLYDNTSLAI
jgi:predicted nucleotidyltransferase